MDRDDFKMKTCKNCGKTFEDRKMVCFTSKKEDQNKFPESAVLSALYATIKSDVSIIALKNEYCPDCREITPYKISGIN